MLRMARGPAVFNDSIMSSPSFRSRGPRPLADIVARPLSEALQRAGFAATEVVTRWDEIVGTDLARRTAPIRIAWPRRAPAAAGEQEPGTLHVRVEAPFALEVQHLMPVIIDRVNAFFGWRCVAALRLSQVPLARRAKAPAMNAPPDEKRLAGALAQVDDPALKASLGRLGRAVGKGRPGTA